MTRNTGFGGTLERLTVLLVAATLVVSAGAAGVALGATSTQVSVQSSQTIEAGQTATFDVVVESTSGDVGAAEGQVALTNPDVAEITDVSFAGSPADASTTIAADGSSAEFTAYYGANSLAGDGPSVTVLTVTVEGTAEGETGVELPEFLVFDDNGDGYDVTGTNSATLTVESPDATGTTDATVTVNEGSDNVDASTFGSGSFEVTNTGDTAISSVTIDLGESIVPDAVFDPDGGAGDSGFKDFTPNSGGSETGLVDGSFSQPHNGQDGSDGYEALTITFESGEFQPGETLTFAVDIDPTTIKGVDDTGGAGSVSGLELSGSSVTVESPSATVTNDLFTDGSQGGAQVAVGAGSTAASTLGVEGVSLSGTDFPAHEAATVSSQSQTLTISGPADESVTLLHLVGTPAPSDGYDIDAFETDTAESVSSQTVQLGPDGTTTVDVSLSETSLNYFMTAVNVDDNTGRTSDTVILDYDPDAGDNTAPTIEAISDQTVTEGEQTTVPVSADDPDGDSVSLSVNGPEFVSLSNGELTIAPESGDAGVYSVEVTADDGTTTTTESFQLTVEEASTGGSGEVVFAVNAGGSQYTAADGTTFAADTNFDGGTPFTSGNSGTPSEPEIENTENDELYWTERYGDFSYDVPVENGQYEVTLYFAEIYQGVANDGGEGDRVFDVSAEGQVVLDNYDIIAEAGAPQTAVSETTSVEVTDGELNLEFTTIEDNAKVSAIKIERVDDGGDTPSTTSAQVDITPNSGVEASTYSGGSYQITNTGDTNIQTVTVDLSETLLPDMVFDPYNTAGDNVGKEFTLDGGDVSVEDVEYTNFHNGQDNDAGYDTLVVTVSGFAPGETMSFSLDNDPTSISSTPLGSQAAGPVSGLELTGGTVSVDSGSGPVEATIVGDGSAGGAEATVTSDESESAPTIGVEDVSLTDIGLSDRHSAATVSEAQQTITITGAPANSEVTLLRVEGELNLNNVPDPYEIEDYEANKAMNVQYYTVTTDANGEATVQVELTDANEVEESGLNYFTAWVNEPDGATGPLSNYAVLELGEPSGTDGPPAVGDFENAPTDPDGDGVYEDVNGDGTFGISDVQAFFQNFDGQVVQDNPDAFDFNGDGDVTISDVQTLFISAQEDS